MKPISEITNKITNKTIEAIIAPFDKTLKDIKCSVTKKNLISITFNSGETLIFA